MNSALQCWEALCCYSRGSSFLTLMPGHGPLEVTLLLYYDYISRSFPFQKTFVPWKVPCEQSHIKRQVKPPATKIILCRFSNCYSIFFPLYSISLTLAIKNNHLETMSLQAGSKSKWQQLKRPREEHLSYIYYCFGFSKNVRNKISFAQHLCMLGGVGGGRRY